jgi:hypothetical protein
MSRTRRVGSDVGRFLGGEISSDWGNLGQSKKVYAVNYVYGTGSSISVDDKDTAARDAHVTCKLSCH